MASASAPLIYRASPIDPTLRPPSTHPVRTFSPPNKAPVAADERALSPLLPPGPDTSRAPTASTYQQQQSTLSNASLPALSTLASVASAPTSQLRAYSMAGQGMTYASASPAATSGGQGNIPPVCQNCQTSTTPLWRRDEIGSVLCNACGLFLKLHGSPRPISLKTDVIKSRNRVKSSAQGQKRKSLFEGNGYAPNNTDANTPPNQTNSNRRTSQKTSSVDSNHSNSPVSRTVTPAIQQPSNIAPQHMFDGVSLSNHDFHGSPSLPSLNLRQPSPSSVSSLNDRHLEPPKTYEELHQAYNTLKTRVSELEVINGLYSNELEQQRMKQHQWQQTEIELKRHVEELEHEVDELRGGPGPRTKGSRLSEASEYPDPPQPFMT